MKTVLQAFIGSIIIHLVYMVGMLIVSYIKTKNYKPDIAKAWDHVETFQNEVVFVKVNSPCLYSITFIGVTVVCGIIILSYKKLLN